MIVPLSFPLRKSPAARKRLEEEGEGEGGNEGQGGEEDGVDQPPSRLDDKSAQ